MAPRALRVGILIGNQLVEERVITGTAPVTLGQALRCTLSIPADGVPREHVLFTRADGPRADADRPFVLHASPTMNGRIGKADRITTLAELRGDAGTAPIPLAHGARGKLTIGDATVLFQEIAAPPVAPRLRLPASIRGTFSDRIDRRLAVIIGGSLAAHFAIAAWAWATDREVDDRGIANVALNHSQDTIDVSLPDPPPPPDVTPSTHAPGIAAPVAPHQTPRPIVPPTHINTHAPDPAHLIDDATQIANLMTSEDPGHGIPGGMAHRQPGVDLNKQLDEARHRTIVIGNTDHTSRSDDRAPIGTGRTTLDIHDPSYVPPTDLHRAEHPPRIIPGTVKPDTRTTLTPDAVLAKINEFYMPGLQRCYRHGLAEDATLGGRVSISFSVDGHGRVTEPTATGMSAQVDSCIAGQMAAWHFPTPHDADGNATEVGFQVALVMQPG